MSSWPGYPQMEAQQPPQAYLVGKFENRMAEYRNMSAYKTADFGEFASSTYDTMQRENIPYHQKIINSKRHAVKKASTGSADKKKQQSSGQKRKSDGSNGGAQGGQGGGEGCDGEASSTSPAAKRLNYGSGPEGDVLRHSVSVNITQELRPQLDANVTVTVSASISNLRPSANVNVSDVKTDVTIGKNQQTSLDGASCSLASKADTMMPGVCKQEPRDDLCAAAGTGGSGGSKASETVGIDAELRDILDTMELENMQGNFLAPTPAGPASSQQLPVNQQQDYALPMYKSASSAPGPAPAGPGSYSCNMFQSVSALHELSSPPAATSSLPLRPDQQPSTGDARSQRNSTGSVVDVTPNVLIRPASASAPYLDGGPAAEALKMMAAHHQSQERAASHATAYLPPSLPPVNGPAYPRFAPQQGGGMPPSAAYNQCYPKPSGHMTGPMHGGPDQQVPSGGQANVAYMQQSLDFRARAAANASYGQMSVMQQQSIRMNGSNSQMHLMQMQQMRMSSAFSADNQLQHQQQQHQQQLAQSHGGNKAASKAKKTPFPDSGPVGHHPGLPGYGVEQSVPGMVDDKTKPAMYGQRGMMAPLVPPYGAFDVRPSYGGSAMPQAAMPPSVRQMLPTQQGQGRGVPGQGHQMGGVPNYPPYGSEWQQQSVMDSQLSVQQQQQRVGGGEYAAYQQQRAMPDMYSHPQQQGDMQHQQQQMVPQTMRPTGGMTMEQYMYAKQCSTLQQDPAIGARAMPRTMAAQQHMVNFGGLPVPDPSTYQAPTPAMWGAASLPSHPDAMYR